MCKVVSVVGVVEDSLEVRVGRVVYREWWLC